MNNIEFAFTVFFGYTIVVFLIVCVWKRLLAEPKKKNPIHFNKPDND